MLPAPFQGHPLQKRTEVQWDMRAWLHADGGANESMSLQLGINRANSARMVRRIAFQPPQHVIELIERAIVNLHHAAVAAMINSQGEAKRIRHAALQGDGIRAF